MRQYIGTKLIQAEPALRIDGKTVQPTTWPVPEGSKAEEGYAVLYPDGYMSWSPKETFEAAYLPLNINTDLKTDAPSVSQEMVDSFILETWTQTLGDKTTVVRAMLKNGFEIVESSACVSAENYDENMGKEICMEKIKDKVWFLLGFLLQTAVHGVKERRGRHEPEHYETAGGAHVRQEPGHFDFDGCFRLHGLHQPDQPGFHDHLRGDYCVLLRDAIPETAGYHRRRRRE